MLRSVLLLLASLCITSIRVHAQTPVLDSLYKVLKTAKEDTNKVYLLCKIVDELSSDNLPVSMDYALQAKQLAEKLNNQSVVASALYKLGDTFYRSGSTVPAAEFCAKALIISQQIGNKQIEAICLNRMGTIYRRQRDYRKAITVLDSARIIFTQLNDKRGIAATFVNLGDCSKALRNDSASLQYYRLALEMDKQVNDTADIAYSLANVAGAYRRLHEFAFAKQLLKESLQMAEAIKNKRSTIINALAELSALAEQQDEHRQAVIYSRGVFELAEQAGRKQNMAEGCEGLAVNFAALRQFDSAYKYQRILLRLKDSLQNNDVIRKIAETEFRGDIEKKKTEIALLQSNQEQQTLLRNALISGVSLLGILAFVLFYSNNQRKKANTLLQNQAAEIQLKNTKLHESLETLRRTQTQLAQAEKMASLGTLVAGVAHELNTPIGVAVTAASTLHVRTHDFAKRYTEGGLKKSELEAYVQTAKTGADLTLRNLERAANLIQSFKQVSVDQTYDNIRRFGVKQYLHEIITSLQPKWKTTGHRVEIECNEALEMETYAGAIAQIITNFVTNSLMHGFEGFTEEGVMKIEAERIGENVIMKYSDNGRGIPPEVLPRIFDPFFTTASGLGGTGLGMHIVFNLVIQKLGGTIQAESHFGKGVHFHIQLPNTIFPSPLSQVQ